MGTRSRIGVMHGNVCKSIYCHWDGYLEYNGTILQESYNSAKANHLVSLGDISSLKELIEIPEGVEHSFESASPNVTVFYGRDRGEENTEFKVADTFAEFLEQCDNCGAEYYYVMENGQWYCGAMYGELKGRLVLLSQALEPVGSWETVTV